MSIAEKRSDLFREYARVIDMCEGTWCDPLACVKIDGEPCLMVYPRFDDTPGKYTFAVAILEGMPVFIGDTLYHKPTGIGFDVTTHVAVDSAKHSWNKPKRTFTLAGKELPLPIIDPEMVPCVGVGNMRYYFNTNKDKEQFSGILNAIIHEAIENARLQNK